MDSIIVSLEIHLNADGKQHGGHNTRDRCVGHQLGNTDASLPHSSQQGRESRNSCSNQIQTSGRRGARVGRDDFETKRPSSWQ